MENSFEIKVNSLDETDLLAKCMADAAVDNACLICLFGQIGAGKTTFVKHVGKYLDIKEKITSPSFVILNEYHSGKISLYHFDLYRLEREGVKSILSELREYSEDSSILTIVEWAEFSDNELPLDRLEVNIKYISDESREFVFTSFGENSNKMLDIFIKNYINKK